MKNALIFVVLSLTILVGCATPRSVPDDKLSTKKALSPEHGSTLAIEMRRGAQGLAQDKLEGDQIQTTFSGRRINFVGDLPYVGKADATIVGRTTGKQISLGFHRAGPKSFKFRIPVDAPTDTYDISLLVGGETYTGSINIVGLTEADTTFSADLSQALALPSAVLATTDLNCGLCYWELALAGQGDHLILAGNPFTATPLMVSHDSAQSWQSGNLNKIPYGGDPESLVTPSGDYLLSALATVDKNLGATGGGLYKGSVTGSSFRGTIYKDVAEDHLPALLFIDYQKLAYAANTDTIYVAADYARVSGYPGLSGAVFVSQDGGRTYVEKRMQTDISLYKILAIDVTPAGALRAIQFSSSDASVYLLRFDATADTFERLPVIDLPNHRTPWGIARVSATSPRGWQVFAGPEIVVDKNPGSPHFGRTYLLWSTPESNIPDPDFEFSSYGFNHDIFLMYSDNDGATWSAPIKVNDDTTTADQVFPSIRIDEQGTVHMAFVDRRENPDLAQFDVYYAIFQDGAVSPNIRVNEFHVTNAGGGRSIGDYLDMIVPYPDKVYVAYPCEGSTNNPADACVTTLDPRLVNTQPGPDLIMTDVNGPSSGMPGETVTVNDTIRNAGTEDVTTVFLSTLFLSTDDVITSSDIILAHRQVASLAAGISDSGSTAVTIPTGINPGTYYFGAIADSFNSISETNESNNTLPGNTITISDGSNTQPDLTMTQVNPGTLTSKFKLDVTNAVLNQGAADAGGFVIGFVLSVDNVYGNGDDIAVNTTRSIPALSVGATSTATTRLNISRRTASGNYFVCANADIDNTVAENNEANNWLCSASTIVVP